MPNQTNDDRNYYVYALLDSRNDSVRYVGQSKDPKSRAKEHRQDHQNIRKYLWVRELRSLGLLPKLLILGEYTKGEILERESDWIKYYVNNGADLVNSAVSKPSSEELLKYCEIRRESRREYNERYENPYDSMYGYRKTQEDYLRSAYMTIALTTWKQDDWFNFFMEHGKTYDFSYFVSVHMKRLLLRITRGLFSSVEINCPPPPTGELETIGLFIDGEGGALCIDTDSGLFESIICNRDNYGMGEGNE